jgi:molecular chaperone DnaK
MEESGGIRTVESPYVVGIDLGTSNSAIAVFADREAKVIPVEGDKTCPSVVGFREDGSVVVGRQARARVLIDPENTVVSVKRLLGTDWKKSFVGQGETQYTPTDISAKILEKLINGSIQNEVCDLKGMPKRVVITIPANFDDAKRQATLDAANMIGLNVLYLLEEPTAAALAYAVDRNTDQTILVYDLGGGTFDVSILDVATEQGTGGNFKVLAKEGIPLLGGDDFDRKLMELASEEFKKTSNVDVMDLTKDQGIRVPMSM